MSVNNRGAVRAPVNAIVAGAFASLLLFQTASTFANRQDEISVRIGSEEYTLNTNMLRIEAMVGKDTRSPSLSFRLGLRDYQRQDYTNAVNNLRAAANGGELDAHYALSVIYRDGREGVPGDSELSRYHLSQAAKVPPVGALVDWGEASLAAAENSKKTPFTTTVSPEDIKILMSLGGRLGKDQDPEKPITRTSYPTYEWVEGYAGIVDSLFLLQWAGRRGNSNAIHLYHTAVDKLSRSGSSADFFDLNRARLAGAVLARPLQEDGSGILTGLKSVGISIQNPDKDAEDDGLTEEAIQRTVELRLRSAGITLRQTDSPILTVIPRCLKSRDLPTYSVSFRVELIADAEYRFKPIRVPIWSRQTTGIYGSQRLREATQVVADLIDEFANEFLKANPKQ